MAGGYTRAGRFLVEAADGRRLFAKVAVDELTAGWLRAEHRLYSRVDGAFLPRLLGWDDDGERPVLLLDDLSGGYWPPPWRPGDVEAVAAALDEVAATPPPSGLPALESLRERFDGWSRIADDPAPFLSLGLCSSDWLEAAIAELRTAAASARLDGDELLHLDVRSDNVCLVDGRALLVDWNWACRGNRLVDLAAWAPSLCAETGRRPEETVPEAGPIAAWLAGTWAASAGLAPPPTAHPSVRAVQLAQLEAALPWAARELGLPLPRPS